MSRMTPLLAPVAIEQLKCATTTLNDNPRYQSLLRQSESNPTIELGEVCFHLYLQAEAEASLNPEASALTPRLTRKAQEVGLKIKRFYQLRNIYMMFLEYPCIVVWSETHLNEVSKNSKTFLKAAKKLHKKSKRA